VISTLAIVAIVVSVLPSLGLFPTATATPRNTSTPSVTATLNVCSPENVQPVALQFDGFSREFNDILEIAQNTDRTQLGPYIDELQTIRRNSEDFALPICLFTLRDLQLSYMNTFIQTILFLYGPDGGGSCVQTNQGIQCPEAVLQLINQGMSQGFQLREQYWDELARVLGVTRVPSPTVPSGTETPSATP
jgi:hypothetical protein